MIHEVLTFEPTEAILADAAGALAPAVKLLGATPGFQGLYFGPAEEDKNTAYIVIAWETREHLQSALELPGSPEVHGLMGAMKSQPTVVTVPFEESPDAALSAGATEVLNITLKDGKTTEDLDQAAKALLAQLSGETAFINPAAKGETFEQPGKGVVFVGWTSIKDHYATVMNETYAPLMVGLKAVVDLKMLHATFTKYA